MRFNYISFCVFFLFKSVICTGQFRVDPYLLPGEKGSIRITWFTEENTKGHIQVWSENTGDTISMASYPDRLSELEYSLLEESERSEFPDMFRNANWKHQVYLKSLIPGTRYFYKIIQGSESFEGRFESPPLAGERRSVRIIALADSETDPDGRTTYRKWEPGYQSAESTGRPQEVINYLLTETEGLKRNLDRIETKNPDFILLPGDLVQGGGYQRAWDEFFFHFSGSFGHLISRVPLLPAIGNWENYGARNGGYDPVAVKNSRAKYSAYFTMPPNNNPKYRNFYYRVDYGPVTVITLDSSNGLPDSTDFDTNININASSYPGSDLPDYNPGSDQWTWALEQLRDAHEQGQVIIVQFHHIPYSSGGHSLPLTAKNSSGQAGIPMRVYTPEFKKYGVSAVICGHNESLEHSVVEGIHFWDVGIAGDGLGYSIDDRDPRRANPYRQWVAHRNSKEQWNGRQLISGGKHYGHLIIDVIPIEDNGYRVKMTPQYIFPITDKNGNIVGTETRTYDHIVEFDTRN